MNQKSSKPLRAKIVADFDNLSSIGQDLDDDESLEMQLAPYNPFEQYEELIALEKTKQKVVKKLRNNDRKKTDKDFRDDLSADKHKALRALRETLEDPSAEVKEKNTAAKAILSQADKQRELDLKESADNKEDVREKAKILIASQIKTEEMSKALAGMAPLLMSAQRELKGEEE